MDAQTVILAVLLPIVGALAMLLLKRTERTNETQQGEIAAMRAEFKELAVVVGSLKTSMDHLSERMNGQPAYAGHGSFLGALSEGLRIMESMRNLGIVRLAA